jgi:hypothetical protein
MNAKSYAEAFVALSKKGDAHAAAMTDALIAYLKSSGRSKLLTRILHEIKIIEKRESDRAPRLEVARTADTESALAAAHAKGLTIAPNRVHVNHALLSGWRVWSAGTLMDHSGKSALITIYKHVTG